VLGVGHKITPRTRRKALLLGKNPSNKSSLTVKKIMSIEEEEVVLFFLFLD
jgi:hypothetical protein